MEKHITILGILYIVFSILGFLVAVVVFIATAAGGVLSGDPEVIWITTTVATSVAMFFVILSIPGLIGGIGLLRQKSWARILVLVLAILNLINIPFGTILGIYSIWALVQPETVQLFDGQNRQPAV